MIIKFFSHVYKENLLLLKNYISYILTLAIPTVAIILNIFMNQSSTIDLKIVVMGDNIQNIVELYKDNDLKINIDIIKLNDINVANYKLENGEINLIIEEDKNSNITIKYNSGVQESIITYQTIITLLQNHISNDLLLNYPLEVEDLQNKQNIRITDVFDLNKNGSEKPEINFMVYFSLMWIIAMTSLNLSINQMQQEKSGNTMYSLIKLPINKVSIILAKQTAVIIQCLIATLLLCVFVNLTGIGNIFFIFRHTGIIILLICCISMFGYFLGLIINNYSVVTLLLLFISLPSMLASSISISSNIENVIKFIPTYYVCSILKNILSSKDIGSYNVFYIIITTLIYFILTLAIFSKREPVKLCKNL